MLNTFRLIAFVTALGGALLIAAQVQADDPPTLEWIRQLGTSRRDVFNHAAMDGFGNVFVGERQSAGTTFQGDYIHKFDNSGNLLWTREIGTPATLDTISGTWADDGGDLYVTAAAEAHSSLIKYDPEGNVLWIRQLESMLDATGSGFGRVVGDGLGNLYLTGSTSGSFAAPNAGLTDALLAKWDINGNHLWTRQLGGASFDDGSEVVPDGRGNVFFSRIDAE